MTTISDVYRMLDLIVKLPPEILKNQRLGQLIANATGGRDIYYFSNEHFLAALNKYVEDIIAQRAAGYYAHEEGGWFRASGDTNGQEVKS